MQTSLTRRDFVKISLYSASALMLSAQFGALPALADDAIGKVTKTEDEWKKSLTSQQFGILRKEDTEHPFTSDLLNEHRAGVFACVGCELPLFNSDKKFDSGTGWPSFFDVIPGHVQTKTDSSLLMQRTEYHCARCAGHHGHLFNDGPQPTGLRYCSNGTVLKFIPKGI